MKYFLVFVLLSFSFSVNAAWTGSLDISSVKVVSSGNVEVYLKDFTNSDANIKCEKNVFVLNSSGQSFDARYSAILSAHMAGKEIEFSYYGCSGESFGISSVVIR